MAFANIVVKDTAGANYTYTAMSPAAGDGIWAEYRGDGPSPAYCPTLRIRTAWNGKRDARRVEVAGSWPVSAVKDGIRSLIAVIPFRMDLTVPQFIEDAEIARSVTVQMNTVASTAVVESGKTGFAPRG